MSTTMSPRSPAAWMLSVALHALVIGLIALFAYTAKLTADKQPVILELVAGPGDDYMATAAPALGTEAGMNIEIPKFTPAPAPIVPAPQPVQESTPIVPAPPVVKPAPEKAPPKPEPTPNFAQQIKKKVTTAKANAKREVERERKKQERISKAEFDRMNAAKKKTAAASAAKSSSSTKYKPIDTKGIRDGVAGGSSASTRGAGGKALTSTNKDVLAAYDALFKINLRRAFEEERPPGLSDALKVTIEVRSNANGTLSGARVTEPSGSVEFDRAVLDALRRMKMPARPDGRTEVLSFVFTMREG